MKNPKRLWMALSLPVIGLALFVLVLELGVLVAIGEQAKFPRRVIGTDFGLRVNQPNVTYRHKSANGTWWFTINSRGLRADREYPYEKPPGALRIVSLGDSFTAGYEVNGDEVFSSVLERELRNVGYDVEVLNAGVSGYSNAEALLYLERELLKYNPDIVLLSFFANDLVDNVRSGLFAVSNGDLTEIAGHYVPAGSLGNFLNTNPVFNWLSGYSNSFVFVKERLTHLVKQQIVDQNHEVVAAAANKHTSGTGVHRPVPEPDGAASPKQILAVAIFNRLYETTHSRGIPLVIQSIPVLAGPDRNELIETFPLDHFDLDRDDLFFLGMKEPLSSFLGDQILYNRDSHGHWTAFSHQISGERLGRLVLDEELLGGPAPIP